MDNFFVTMVFFDMENNYLDGNFINIYDMNNLMSFHIHLYMKVKFIYSQLHLNFYHNSILLSAFFYKADNFHDDSFFNIYVLDNSEFFNIFYRIEIIVFINYISSFLNFFHINMWLKYLNVNMVDIFLYGIIKDKDVYNMDLFFDYIFYHMNEVLYLFNIQDLKTSHNNNNILVKVNYSWIYIVGNSN
jgi:hypothetical protein